jgi:protein-L-isoaspartate(D-aspartate) O-methyltransferase
MSTASGSDEYAALRRQMVASQLRGRRIADSRVLDAMERVPRHEFVAQSFRGEVYQDHPLPIGCGQTISQPYIVALMLEALMLTPTDKVLEVGTGSGYVTALLAELTAQVISIERHAGLATQAEQVLASMGYKNASIVVGDGSRGFPQFAPYDAILVSAAAAQLPPALLTQLREGGRLIIPVGQAESQQLQLIHKQHGQPHTTSLDPCRFVPLISDTNAISGC